MFPGATNPVLTFRSNSYRGQQMTSQQQAMTKNLSEELAKRGHRTSINWKASDRLESRGFLFGEIEGVTITVTPGGLINIPSVRTYHPPKYPTPVIAAASAGELWAKQKVRDHANPSLARIRRTGHLGPIISYDLRCNNQACPCHSETDDIRQRRERGGFNEDPFKCS
jgi:hypothetical protein